MCTHAHNITYVLFSFIRPNFGVNVKEECIDVWSMICYCLGSMLEDAKKDKLSLAPAMKLGIYGIVSVSMHVYGGTSIREAT